MRGKSPQRAADHPGQGLSLNIACVGIGNVGLQLLVKLIGFAQTCGEDRIEVGEVTGRARHSVRAVLDI